MADSVLASDVILDARERVTDEVDEAIVDDAGMLRWLRQEWKRLYALYVEAEPDRFRQETTINLAGGVATSTVDTTWLATVGVDYVQSPGLRVPLHRLQEPERDIFSGAPTAQFASAFRVIGDGASAAITFYPTPGASSYIHIWIPTAPAIASAASSIDVRNGHDMYLAMCLARRLFEREDQYDGRFEKRLELLEQQLLSEANMRYMFDADRSFARGRMRVYDPADYRRRW